MGLELAGRHGLITFIFRAVHRDAYAALRRHWPEKAAEIKAQTARCLRLDRELSSRALSRLVQDGRTKRSILYDGKEWALTAAGVVTCDGVPTEYRVARFPSASVVLHAKGCYYLAYRTHDREDHLRMALFDVALLMTERGEGPGRVKLDEHSTHLTPIPDAKSFKPRSTKPSDQK